MLEGLGDDDGIGAGGAVGEWSALAFVEGVHGFHALQGPVGAGGGLESCLRPEGAFESPVVAFDDVVAVL